MSDIHLEVKELTRKVNSADSGFARSNALTNLITGVSQFVSIAQAQKDLASKVSELGRNISSLQSELKRTTDEEKVDDLMGEISTKQQDLSAAQQASKDFDKNRETLKVLLKHTEELRAELNRALN